MKLKCLTCKRPFLRVRAEHEYRLRHGMTRPYCSQACFGKSRRVPKKIRVAAKAAYDVKYRAKNLERIRANKAAYFKRTYDPVKAVAERKKRMRYHVEYCRRYYADRARKAHKVQYDADRRAADYGEFADAYKAHLQLQKLIRAKCPDKYQRLRARGYYDEGGLGWLGNRRSKVRRANSTP